MNEGGYWDWLPMHGAVTDFNVWSRVLTPRQIADWAHCKVTTSPDLVDWSKAQLNISRLDVDFVEYVSYGPINKAISVVVLPCRLAARKQPLAPGVWGYRFSGARQVHVFSSGRVLRRVPKRDQEGSFPRSSRS